MWHWVEPFSFQLNFDSFTFLSILVWRHSVQILVYSVDISANRLQNKVLLLNGITLDCSPVYVFECLKNLVRIYISKWHEEFSVAFMFGYLYRMCFKTKFMYMTWHDCSLHMHAWVVKRKTSNILFSSYYWKIYFLTLKLQLRRMEESFKTISYFTSTKYESLSLKKTTAWALSSCMRNELFVGYDNAKPL